MWPRYVLSRKITGNFNLGYFTNTLGQECTYTFNADLEVTRKKCSQTTKKSQEIFRKQYGDGFYKFNGLNENWVERYFTEEHVDVK